MLKKSVVLILFLCFYNYSPAQDIKEKVVENLIISAEQIDKSSGIRIPWNGSNTKSPVFTILDSSLSDKLFLNIVHPKNYSLFLNDLLLYSSQIADSIKFSISELKSISKSSQLSLVHNAEMLNEGNLQVKLKKEPDIYDVKILKNESRLEKKLNLKVIFLILFFSLAIVRILSKREFDFYFSGNFLRSPRLTLEKFLGDSINPFILFLAILFLAIVMNSFIYNFDFFKYEYGKFLGFEIDNYFFKIGLYIVLIIFYLFFKRTFYLYYLWNRQETRNFSALWRTYLLSFSNLSFWFFLLCSIPLLLLSNLELGNYFQILFFIFAALNAIGGIMTYLNFNVKVDLLTISGILAIDVFPIILLVHFLTF